MTLVFLCCTSTELLGQKVYNITDVQAMFGQQMEGVKILLLSGTIDGAHAIDMILGQKDSIYKGVYTLRSSQMSFFLEGDSHSEGLELIEINQDYRMSGFVKGAFEGQRFKGVWKNKNLSIALPIELNVVSSFSDAGPSNCADDYWCQISSGKVDDKNIKLSINRAKDWYHIKLWQEGDLYKDTIHLERGKNLHFADPFEGTVLFNKKGVIDTSDINQIDLVVTSEYGEEVWKSLKVERILQYQCYEYADQRSRIQCTYPHTGNKKFDSWINDLYQTYISSNTKKIHAVKDGTFSINDRWGMVAYAWVEVDLFLEDMISGTIYFQSSWSDKTEKLSFMYDLKNNKKLELQDIFDKNFDSDTYFNLVVPAAKKEIKWRQDCKSWVEKQNFNYITLTDRGISFKTEFNTIFGEKEIVIPYSNIEGNLKNKSLLKDLIR